MLFSQSNHIDDNSITFLYCFYFFTFSKIEIIRPQKEITKNLTRKWTTKN